MMPVSIHRSQHVAPIVENEFDIVQFAFEIIFSSPDLLILFESSNVTVSLHLNQTTKTMTRKQQNTRPLDNVINVASFSCWRWAAA